jgi:phenylalanyl-tRNA synthetase beta chain
MKFSESWLRQFVNPSLSLDQLVAQITMSGLEVDGLQSVTPQFSGVVVGEIVDVCAHPNADKLSLCQVSTGEITVEVVCGAPNVRIGIKVPFARVGAVLPDNFKIKKAKLRGVASHGMLCAQTELQLGDDDAGLWELPTDAPVGQDLVAYLSLNDNVIELDLTPNRGDCLSIRGLSREIGVLNRESVAGFEHEPIAATIDEAVVASLEAPQACARYLGRVIRNPNLKTTTPPWLQERLRRSGIRSLGPVVDITNYVMLELGQPMHAFDLDKIDGDIVVRMGRGEKLALLDGSEVNLGEDTLVIADQCKPLSMAGIMGGASSAISDDTADILLESAWFNPLFILGKARNYGKHTDSSHRFERGVDTNLQSIAMERATALILQICGGNPGPISTVEATDHLPKPATITLRDSHLAEQLGLKMAVHEVDDILSRLGLELLERNNGHGTWLAPSWRFDLSIEQDLVEEVARIYGYDNLPLSTPSMTVGLAQNAGKPQPFKDRLAARGYREVITYSFVHPKMQELLDRDNIPIPVTNPISADMSVMRTSLWPGLINTALHNLNRQQDRVRIFEVGQCFLSLDKPTNIIQNTLLAGLICGTRAPIGWDSTKREVDFYDLKGDLEIALSDCGTLDELTFRMAQHSALHPGRSAELLHGDREIGWIGQLHPRIQASLGISKAVYLFQVDISQVAEFSLPRYKSMSVFPEVRRDLAFFVDASVVAAEFISVAKSAAGDNLSSINLFDVYHNEDFGKKGKSVALGLTFQHDSRTLKDEEVNESVDCIIESLCHSFDAELRI